MPNRLIRDDMLDSERVQSLPVEARWLFVTVMLCADDLGLLDIAPYRLGRRSAISPDVVLPLLQLLADADLIRLYEHGGKKYAVIPRFRQKLQIKRAKCPLPPDALFSDDADMASKVNVLRESEETGALVGAFGKEWEVLRGRVFARDGWACIRCLSADKLSAHHLTPKSKGGKHVLENLVTLCSSCNSWARNNDERCNEIKDLALKKVSGQHLDSMREVSVGHSEPEPEPEPEPEEEPKKEEKKRKTDAPAALVSLSALKALGVEETAASSWLAARKAKRLPLTRSALAGVQREAEKAGVTLAQAIGRAAAEGWAGFKADWMLTSAARPGGAGFNKQEALEARNRAVGQRWLESMKGKTDD